MQRPISPVLSPSCSWSPAHVPEPNHIAFLENDSAENRTVTRGHALIGYNGTTGEYRLFDEGSANGTRVVRSGEVIDVPKRDPVGLALRSGDEVQLGKAAIKVRIGAAADRRDSVITYDTPRH